MTLKCDRCNQPMYPAYYCKNCNETHVHPGIKEVIKLSETDQGAIIVLKDKFPQKEVSLLTRYLIEKFPSHKFIILTKVKDIIKIGKGN